MTLDPVPSDTLSSVEVSGSGGGEWGFNRGLVSLDRPHGRCRVTFMGRSDGIHYCAFTEGDPKLAESLPGKFLP